MGCGGSKSDLGGGDTLDAKPEAEKHAGTNEEPAAAAPAAAATTQEGQSGETNDEEDAFPSGAVGSDSPVDEEEGGEGGDSFPEDIDPASAFPTPSAKARVSVVPVMAGEVGREEIAAKIASRISMAAITSGIAGGANRDASNKPATTASDYN